MAGKGSFIPVPRDVSNSETLYRFLSKLVEQLDVAFGNRGNSAFLPQSAYDDAQTAAAKAAVQSGGTTVLNPSDYSDGVITGLLSKIDAALLYARADGAKELSGVQKYSADVVPTENLNLVDKKYVDASDNKKVSLNGSNRPTSIIQYAYSFGFSGDTDIVSKGYVDSVGILKVNLDGTNSPTAPIDYSADHSSSYTARSLVDLGYIQANYYTAAQVNSAISTAIATHAGYTSGVHGLP